MKTTLIFGAGVSYNYGYPNGKELVDKIIQVLPHNEFTELRDELIHEGPYSIDRFLKEKPHHIPAVKKYIAHVLLSCEHPDRLYNSSTLKSDFYRQFVNQVKPRDYDKFEIITFNYDRSFQYYILNYLYHHFRPNLNSVNTQGELNKIIEQYNKLKIHNVFGRLSNLGIEDVLSEKYDSQFIIPFSNYHHLQTDYGSFNSRDVLGKIQNCDYQDRLYKDFKLNIASEKIKLNFEHNSIEETKFQFKKILSQSKRIFILGLGFDPLNMELLGFTSNNTKKEHNYSDIPIAATAYGLGYNELRRIRHQYPEIKHFVDTDVHGLFENYYSLVNPEYDFRRDMAHIYDKNNPQMQFFSGHK